MSSSSHGSHFPPRPLTSPLSSLFLSSSSPLPPTPVRSRLFTFSVRPPSGGFRVSVDALSFPATKWRQARRTRPHLSFRPSHRDTVLRECMEGGGRLVGVGGLVREEKMYWRSSPSGCLAAVTYTLVCFRAQYRPFKERHLSVSVFWEPLSGRKSLRRKYH